MVATSSPHRVLFHPPSSLAPSFFYIVPCPMPSYLPLHIPVGNLSTHRALPHHVLGPLHAMRVILVDPRQKCVVCPATGQGYI